jgi:hypothetical protein
MALIDCPKCNNKVSDKAEKCPHWVAVRLFCAQNGSRRSLENRIIE